MRRLFAVLTCCACAHGQKPAEGKAWLAVQSGHFLVRTDLPETDARALVQSLEEARAVFLQVLWPGQAGPPGLLPVVVLADAAEASEATTGVAGGFFQPMDPFGQRLVVISAGDARLANHELAHALANHFLVRQPPWLSEGLAQYLQTLQLDHGHGRAVVGGLDKGLLALAQRNSSVYRGGVLAVGSDLGELRGEERARFYAASWLFVHYLIDERRDGLNAYAARLAHGQDPQKAFDAQFPDLGEEAIQRALHDHLHGEGTLPMFSVALSDEKLAVELAPLPPAEALALRASLYLEKAPGREQAIAAALRADPANPLALAVSGAKDASGAIQAHPDDWRAFFLRWRTTGDRKALEKAARLSPKNPVVLAELSFTRGKAGRPDEALALAVQAVSLAPGSSRNLEALAWALAAKRRCKEALSAGARAIEVLSEGVPHDLLARARGRLVDLQSRCGVTPGKVEMAEEADTDTQPVRKQCGPPPQASARGPLTADYLVREDGTVGDVTVSGDAAASVLRAFEQFVKSCRYQPGTKDGKPVAVRLRQDLSIRAR